MRILLVEPYAHTVSHAPQYARDVSLALTNAGAQVSLLTFDRMVGSKGLTKSIECHAVVNHVGVLRPLLRILSRLLHFTFVLPFTSRPFHPGRTEIVFRPGGETLSQLIAPVIPEGKPMSGSSA